MSEVVKLSRYAEERMSQDWVGELIEKLKDHEHPTLTDNLIHAVADGMDLVEEAKPYLGCLPLGVEFCVDEDDPNKGLLFLYDRYRTILFADKGTSRVATDEELKANGIENGPVEIQPFMIVAIRSLKASEKLLLRSREVKSPVRYCNAFQAYTDELIGPIEQSGLAPLMASIVVRLEAVYGYRIHSWKRNETYEDGKFMTVVLTGEGLELEIEVNPLHLHNQFTDFLRRMERHTATKQKH